MPAVSSDFLEQLKLFSSETQAVFSQFDGAHLKSRRAFPLPIHHPSHFELTFEGATWRCQAQLAPVIDRSDAFDLNIQFTLAAGSTAEMSVGVSFTFGDWNADNYVLMPAAVYNGNRFEARPMKYPPILKNAEDIGPNVPAIISDVPRLNNHAGVSRIQQLTRDLATPAVGFFAPHTALGFWLLTEQSTRLGDTGLDIEESPDRRRAVITVSAPGVRIAERYTIGSTHFPSTDRGAAFTPGDSVKIRMRLFFFHCPRVQVLFERFVQVRKDLAGETQWRQHIPFSSAWEILEEKYNRSNWDESHGYYAVGLRDESIYSHWQIGWVGGLMATYPLLAEGTPLSRQRALRTFDFVIPAGQDQSGFFHGIGKEGLWFGDNFDDVRQKWLLIRKNSDALYFMLKQLLLLHKQDPHWTLPPAWADSIRRCAGAFVRLWDSRGQFGQFVDTQTGDILVGGSTSASTAPAGLALAWQYFQNDDYLRVAKASARFFYDQFVQKGFTTGGPGEILQCPDSESAFGLLESFVVMYEVTQEPEWLQKAREQADQCFTWCVSYDFQFPPDSTFGRLDMRTLGSVYANVQNKHSAPGICTLSGDSLFKLFRATGDRRYLELVREIAHNLPQYLSRADRPISAMPPGWMNERVEMSDWLEPVGEIFYGSCWPEVTTMLAYAEIPGLYIQVDTALVCAIDHIDAEQVENTPRHLTIRLTNPTTFPARVKMLVETEAKTAVPLGQNALWDCQKVTLEAGETLILKLEKHP
jgi:hypothetical protein